MTDAVAASAHDALADAGRRFESSPPVDILRWATDTFGSRLTFATGFGAEGCVLVDLIGRHGLKIDLFTLDTGVLFPETYDLWRQLEDRYNFTIRGVQPSLSIAQQASAHGPELWTRESERCCQMRKVSPLVAQLSEFDAWITAIRRDQTEARSTAMPVEWDPKFGLGKVNPLVRWTKKDVWAHIFEHEVPYNPLHDRGYQSIGCLPCTSSVNPGEDDRAGRWRGAEKTECGLHASVESSAESNQSRFQS